MPLPPRPAVPVELEEVDGPEPDADESSPPHAHPAAAIESQAKCPNRAKDFVMEGPPSFAG
jgi:hypothetical protein